MRDDVRNDGTAGPPLEVPAYAAMVARIAQRLRTACAAIPDWRMRVERTVDFGKMLDDGDASDVSDWLTGEECQVREAKFADEYVGGDDEDMVRRELDDLLAGEFRREIEDCASACGIHPSDLVEDILSEQSLSREAIGFQGCYTVEVYEGAADVTAATGITAAIAPGEALFMMLESLRIRPEVFLAEVEAHCAEHAPGRGACHSFGLDADDLDDAGSLFEAYRGQFTEALGATQARHVMAHEFLEGPVIDADDLLRGLLLNWDQGSELYVHCTCDAEDISRIGSDLAVCFTPEQRKVLSVRMTGVLSCDADPSNEVGAMRTRAPVGVDLQALSVSKPYGEGLGGTLALAEPDQVACEIRRAIDSRNTRQGTLSDAEWIRIEAELEALVARVPEFRRRAVMARLPVKQDDAVRQRVSDALMHRLGSRAWQGAFGQMMGRDLIALLGYACDMEEAVREQALWLVRNGADVHALGGNGVAVVHAAARLVDVELLEELARAGADLARTQYFADGRGRNALSIAVQEARFPQAKQCIEYLIERGCALPERPAGADPGCRSALEYSISSGIEALVVATLRRMEPKERPEQQQVIDRCFLKAGMDLDVKLGATLLDGGADPNQMVEGREGAMLSLEQAIAQDRKAADGVFPPGVLAFEQMLQAARAKAAIGAVMATARLRHGL